jgi:hypothetical protein
MVVKVTKNASISSVHIGNVKNPLVLYNLLQTVLGENISLFTKPKIDAKEGVIEWESDFIGEPLSYIDASEETQHQIRGILRRKVKEILKDRDAQQSELLKNSLEIPDESDIFLIGDEVVLTNWGHIQNSYNARRGIIFNLLGNIDTLLTITVKKDGKPLGDFDFELRYGDKTLNLKTDPQGLAKELVPIDSDVEVVAEYEGREFKAQKQVESESEAVELNIKSEPVVADEVVENQDESGFKWWWLLLLLLLLLLLFGGWYLWKNRQQSEVPQPPTPQNPPVTSPVDRAGSAKGGGLAESSNQREDIAVEISWKKEAGDFDLHLIDSCGHLVDNFHKSSECRGKKITFQNETQGFNCEGGICKERIVAKSGIEGKVKIIINQYSKKDATPEVNLNIKEGDSVVLSKKFTISSPHPMLKRVNPNEKDVVLEWN